MKINKKLESYTSSAKSSKKIAKVAGFGAAVATGLLSASQAEADIVFTPGFSGVFATASVAFAFDIDGDSNLDVAIGVINAVGGTTDGNGGFGVFSSTGFNSKGGFAFQGNGASFPTPYQQAASGGTVSSANVATTGAGWMGWVSGGAATSDNWGVFANPGVTQTGIMGFQFNGSSANGNANATMNAWVQINLLWDDSIGATAGTIEGGELFFGIGGWAYNNDPTDTYNGTVDGVQFNGTAGGIHIGAIPEPATGTLALLALGALGVRRRKNLAA